jgi:hypothetical protein
VFFDQLLHLHQGLRHFAVSKSLASLSNSSVLSLLNQLSLVVLELTRLSLIWHQLLQDKNSSSPLDVVCNFGVEPVDCGDVFLAHLLHFVQRLPHSLVILAKKTCALDHINMAVAF